MTRVDFRLVHGQIVVKWCKACDVDKIVVIDDVVASDDFMSQIYASAAPAGVVVKSYSQEKAKRLWEKNRFGEKSKVLILFKDIDTCYAMIKGGMELKSVQLGGVPQMVDTGVNGYLAAYCNSLDFAHGIAATLNSQSYAAMCRNARAKALKAYDEKAVAKAYAAVYAME